MIDLIAKNNVSVSGTGQKTMLFVHGFGCDQHMWRFVAPDFEQDYQVILIDLVGAGNSDIRAYHKQKYETLAGHAQDIIDLCDFLGLHDVIFVGHSVSAMIGALVDISQPGLLASIVMVGPSPRYINDGDYVGGFNQSDIEELLQTMDSNYLGWSQALAPSIMGNPERPELGQELTESFCRTEPTIAKQFARVTFFSDNRADLPRVVAKSLIIQCSDDIIAPESVGKYLHDKIPNSQLTILQATGHCPHLSAPEETIGAIRDFLQG